MDKVNQIRLIDQHPLTGIFLLFLIIISSKEKMYERIFSLAIKQKDYRMGTRKHKQK